MTLIHRYMDNAPAIPSCLPGNSDESMAEERESFFSLPLSQEVSEDSEEKSRKPRILTIRGELVDLTGDPLTASILGQMLYWCQRVPDFNLYIEEERMDPPKCFISLQHGWFYKSKQELIEETMMRVTLATFRRYLNFLKDRGWIQTRRDPENKLSAKVQYRMSLRKICNDLHRKGHTLRGFESYGIFPYIPKDSSPSKPAQASSVAQDNTNSQERPS